MRVRVRETASTSLADSKLKASHQPHTERAQRLSELACRGAMPKNKGKGGKNRRRGKNEGEEKRELVFKEHGQEYAQVSGGLVVGG